MILAPWYVLEDLRNARDAVTRAAHRLELVAAPATLARRRDLRVALCALRQACAAADVAAARDRRWQLALRRARPVRRLQLVR